MQLYIAGSILFVLARVQKECFKCASSNVNKFKVTQVNMKDVGRETMYSLKI